MNIKSISLENVLPKVFLEDGERTSARHLTSGIHPCVSRPASAIASMRPRAPQDIAVLVYNGCAHRLYRRISFDTTDIATLGINDWCELRRTSLAYLPQELDIFDELTALDNVLLKNRLTDFHTEGEIRSMFEALEIDNRISRPAGKLSVGQKQRVALIRALCQPFSFILLDER